MCLYPRIVPNPKYRPNKKNGGNVPKCKDKRLMGVPIGCGNCIECRKQKAREWQIRINEELKDHPTKNFVTLTLSNESIDELTEAWKSKNESEPTENDIAGLAIRRFCERWRKKTKKSIKHWLVTELGDEGTERIHIHGLIWTNDWNKVNETWGYGWTDNGDYVNEKSVNYIIKYIYKVDKKHPKFKAKVFTSAGIGNGYTKRAGNFNKYSKNNTKEYYRTKEGYKLALPIYYRNKTYTEEEREELWLEKMDKKTIYITGTPYSIKTEQDIKDYLNALKVAQKDNIKNGYGKIEWKNKDYKKALKNINNNFVDNIFD